MPHKSRTAVNPEDNPYGSIGGSGTAGALQFAGIDEGVLTKAADAVTSRGDALVLSRTSDGGALSIRVLHDSLVTKWYAGNLDELHGLLERLAGVR